MSSACVCIHHLFIIKMCTLFYGMDFPVYHMHPLFFSPTYTLIMLYSSSIRGGPITISHALLVKPPLCSLVQLPTLHTSMHMLVQSGQLHFVLVLTYFIYEYVMYNDFNDSLIGSASIVLKPFTVHSKP